MPRKAQRWLSLKRPKIRQDWSKENLYNLSRYSYPRDDRKTVFQQKWKAKALTRGYHNPYVREGKWTRMFDRRLPAVVPMDYKYLAANDGSEQAAGRGSGLDQPIEPSTDNKARERMQRTPYMHMTFHPLERRLDTAIWRALFASSAKQARQMVIHGAVKVNGKKMRFPGYMLNPGDMFSVDPEKVMYATGAMKYDKDQHQSRQDRDNAKGLANENEKDIAEEEVAEQTEDIDGGSVEEQEALATLPEEENDPKKALKSLMIRAQRILDDSKRQLSGKRQQELRQFTRSVRATMSKLRGVEEDSVPETIESLEKGLAEILVKVPQEEIPKDIGNTSTVPLDTPAPSNPQMQDHEKIAERDARLLHAALQRARENPIDVTKPYATPWKPRAFMSAFAFIPRYLEVNQNICSAIYLRHPVARPGVAEVPTPFNEETLSLAFNWYLRRR